MNVSIPFSAAYITMMTMVMRSLSKRLTQFEETQPFTTLHSKSGHHIKKSHSKVGHPMRKTHLKEEHPIKINESSNRVPIDYNQNPTIKIDQSLNRPIEINHHSIQPITLLTSFLRPIGIFLLIMMLTCLANRTLTRVNVWKDRSSLYT